MVTDPVLHPAGDSHKGVLLWQWPVPVEALSSASVGGGTSQPLWVANIGVPLDYERTDLSAHAAEITSHYGLEGVGVGLFTAAAVDRVCRGVCDGVAVDATVGVTKPTWAADPSGGWNQWEPGTINIVVQVPVTLSPGAAVNAVITATEAKTQALMDTAVPGTGTASDAVVIVWPLDGEPLMFAGPRSRWGSSIAQATYAAVCSGVERSS